MPASRWNTNPAQFFKWLEDEENNIKESYSDLILQFMAEQSQSEGENVEDVVDTVEEPVVPAPIPTNLPILPLRGLVVYPQTAVPLTIGQPRSIRLVDDVAIGEKLIGLVTARDPEMENPGRMTYIPPVRSRRFIVCFAPRTAPFVCSYRE